MFNSVAIVTGSSSGIGRATAVRVSRDFAGVVLVARNAAELKAVAKQVRANGAEPLVVDLDLSVNRLAKMTPRAGDIVETGHPSATKRSYRLTPKSLG
jgi:3-oxoacyl-[acyl-carrier protein] reductase